MGINNAVGGEGVIGASCDNDEDEDEDEDEAVKRCVKEYVASEVSSTQPSCGGLPWRLLVSLSVFGRFVPSAGCAANDSTNRRTNSYIGL